jgi:hypothetical protein
LTPSGAAAAVAGVISTGSEACACSEDADAMVPDACRYVFGGKSLELRI